MKVVLIDWFWATFFNKIAMTGKVTVNDELEKIWKEVVIVNS
jgi:hypothetical protein